MSLRFFSNFVLFSSFMLNGLSAGIYHRSGPQVYADGTNIITNLPGEEATIALDQGKGLENVGDLVGVGNAIPVAVFSTSEGIIYNRFLSLISGDNNPGVFFSSGTQRGSNKVLSLLNEGQIRANTAPGIIIADSKEVGILNQKSGQIWGISVFSSSQNIQLFLQGEINAAPSTTVAINNQGHIGYLLLDGTTLNGSIEGGAGSAKIAEVELKGIGGSTAEFNGNFDNLVINDPNTDWDISGTGHFFNGVNQKRGSLNFSAGSLTTNSTILGSDATMSIANGASFGSSIFQAEAGSKLNVNGDLIGTLILLGNLKGVGTIDGNLSLRNTGVISPGNSIGTMTVTGGLDVVLGGKLNIELDPLAGGQKADLLDITGSLTNTKNLAVHVDNLDPAAVVGDFVAITPQTIVQANSIDGNILSLQQGANLPAVLGIQANTVPGTPDEIQLAFSELPLHQLPNKDYGTPRTTNQQNVISGLAAGATGTVVNGAVPLTSGNAALAQTLSEVSNQHLLNLAAFHAEGFSSYLTVGLEQLDNVGYRVLHRAGAASLPCDGTIANCFDPCRPLVDPCSEKVFWQDTSYADGHVEGQGDLGNFGYSLFNFMVGADLLSRCDWSAGLFVGYGHQRLHEHDFVMHDLETDSYYLGAYGRYHFGCYTLRGELSYHYHDHESQRFSPDDSLTLGVDPFTYGGSVADYKSHGYHGRLEAYRCIQWDSGWSLIPHLALSFSYLDQEEFQEEGVDLDHNFNVLSTSADSWTTGVGIELVKQFCGCRSTWYPRIHVHYEYDWSAGSNSEHDIVVEIPQVARFDQVGQNRGEHGVLGGVGLTVEATENLYYTFGYNYSWHNHGEEQRIALDLLFHF